MKRMKTFWTYFLLFVGFYIFVSLVAYFGTKDLQKDITNYEILQESPEIKIEECKAGYSKGYITGTIKNDTGSLINRTYIKMEFFDTNNRYLGTKCKEIKFLNANEEVKFDIIYRYTKVDSIKISLVDEEPQKDENEASDELFVDEAVNVLLPFAGIFILYYIIPGK